MNNSYMYIVMVDCADCGYDYYSEIAGVFNNLDIAISLRDEINRRGKVLRNGDQAHVINLPVDEFISSKYKNFIKSGHKILDSKYWEDASGTDDVIFVDDKNNNLERQIIKERELVNKLLKEKFEALDECITVSKIDELIK